MSDETNEILLNGIPFILLEDEERFGTFGKYYALPPKLGSGICWIYEPNNLFAIEINDFYYYEDYIFDGFFPEALSVIYYESVSGEELSPYKRLASNIIRTHIGAGERYRCLVHRKIPIRSVGIVIKPEYYDNYLRVNYPGEFHNMREIFLSFGETSHFPEMITLLNQIKKYRGDGASARLFYEAKVAEAVSLVVEFQKTRQNRKQPRISMADQESIHTVTMYIRDHYADDLALDSLTRIACVCATKLKKNFKLINDCTITEYIQSCRMGQAQHLLQYTDLSVNMVAQAVGYQNASRFTELFKRYAGLMPKEYRK